MTPSSLTRFGTTFPLEKSPRLVQGPPGTAAGTKAADPALAAAISVNRWPLVVKHWITPVLLLPAAFFGDAVKGKPDLLAAGFLPKPKKPISELSNL